MLVRLILPEFTSQQSKGHSCHPDSPPWWSFCVNMLFFLYRDVEEIPILISSNWCWKCGRRRARPTWACLWGTPGLLQRKTHFWSLAPSSGPDSPATTPPPHTRMCISTFMDTSQPEAFFSGLILCLTSNADPPFDSLLFCALACARVCFWKIILSFWYQQTRFFDCMLIWMVCLIDFKGLSDGSKSQWTVFTKVKCACAHAHT